MTKQHVVPYKALSLWLTCHQPASLDIWTLRWANLGFAGRRGGSIAGLPAYGSQSENCLHHLIIQLYVVTHHTPPSVPARTPLLYHSPTHSILARTSYHHTPGPRHPFSHLSCIPVTSLKATSILLLSFTITILPGHKLHYR
jgi:hypothetical protein